MRTETLDRRFRRLTVFENKAAYLSCRPVPPLGPVILCLKQSQVRLQVQLERAWGIELCLRLAAP